MKISENLKYAIQDYNYLLNKDYPEKGIKKFVGDRYSLSGKERSLLYRGIQKTSQIKSRKEKLIPGKDISSKVLHIDTYNVLLTIISYLKGKPLFLSTDGLVRDAAEVHGKKIRNTDLQQSVSLCFQSDAIINSKKLIFYIDEELSSAKQLSALLKSKNSGNRISCEAVITNKPDSLLISSGNGIICSSDSEIIDSCIVPVFDLGKYILDFHFKPEYLDILSTIS